MNSAGWERKMMNPSKKGAVYTAIVGAIYSAIFVVLCMVTSTSHAGIISFYGG